MTFLKWLQAEAEKISLSDISGSAEPVAKDEKIVGQIDDPLTRKMFVMRKPLKDRLDQVLKAIEFMRVNEDSTNHDPKKCVRCQAITEALCLTDRQKALHELFWANVYSSLTDEVLYLLRSNREALGIRDGWKLVAMPSDAPTPTLVIIEHLGPRPDPRSN